MSFSHFNLKKLQIFVEDEPHAFVPERCQNAALKSNAEQKLLPDTAHHADWIPARMSSQTARPASHRGSSLKRYRNLPLAALTHYFV